MGHREHGSGLLVLREKSIKPRKYTRRKAHARDSAAAANGLIYVYRTQTAQRAQEADIVNEQPPVTEIARFGE